MEGERTQAASGEGRKARMQEKKGWRERRETRRFFLSESSAVRRVVVEVRVLQIAKGLYCAAAAAEAAAAAATVSGTTATTTSG